MVRIFRFVPRRLRLGNHNNLICENTQVWLSHHLLVLSACFFIIKSDACLGGLPPTRWARARLHAAAPCLSSTQLTISGVNGVKPPASMPQTVKPCQSVCQEEFCVNLSHRVAKARTKSGHRQRDGIKWNSNYRCKFMQKHDEQEQSDDDKHPQPSAHGVSLSRASLLSHLFDSPSPPPFSACPSLTCGRQFSRDITALVRRETVLSTSFIPATLIHTFCFYVFTKLEFVV